MVSMPSPGLVALIVVWYALSSGYSIYAKIGLREDRTVSDAVLTLLQMVFGVLSSIAVLRGNVRAIWAELSASPTLLAVAAAYTAGAALTSASMALGSVAIAYVVKSTEPLGSVALSRLLLGQRFSIGTLAALVPLCLGLVLACYSPPAEPSGDSDFSPGLGAMLALAANMGMSVRNVTTKLRQEAAKAADGAHEAQATEASTGAAAERLPDQEEGEEEDSGKEAVAVAAGPAAGAEGRASALSRGAAVFGAVSLAGLVLAAGLVAMDPTGVSQAHLQSLPRRLSEGSDADRNLVLSAACHAGYTLCSFTALRQLEPASHAVVTALKQLLVIVAAALLLGSPMTWVQCLGAAMAVGGVALYGAVRSADPLKEALAPSSAALSFLSSWPVVGAAAIGTTASVALLRPYPGLMQ